MNDFIDNFVLGLLLMEDLVTSIKRWRNDWKIKKHNRKYE